MRPIRFIAVAVAAVTTSAIGAGPIATSTSAAQRPGGAPSAERTAGGQSPRDVGSLLAAARGAPPVLCGLAARAIGTGDLWAGAVGWGEDAPAPPLASALPSSQRAGVGESASGESASEADIGGDGYDQYAPDDSPRARGRLSPPDSARLLQALAADDACVRELAARILAHQRDSALAAPLAARLGAAAAPTRAAAAFTLGLAAPAGGLDALAIDALARALADTSSDVRANAAWALGRARAGRALPLLVAHAGDADPRVRAAVVTAAGRLASTRSVDSVRVPATTGVFVRVLRQDPDPRVRRAAAWALAGVGADRGVNSEAGGSVADRARSGSAAVRERGVDGGAEAALTAALARDGDYRVREMAAWALSSRAQRAADTRPAFVAALRTDTSAAVRETAAWALGVARTDDSVATDALAAAASGDRSARVRGTAAWALGRSRLRGAPAGLVRAVRDADPGVRLRAAWALGQRPGPAVVPALRNALAREADPRVRRALVRALVSASASGGVGPEQVLAPLLRSGDPQVRAAAARGLVGRDALAPWPWPRPRPFP